MNLAHVHIVLNHIPSLGCIAGLLLLAAAIRTKNEALKKFSFQVLVLIAMSMLPTYISGAEAQRFVRKLPDVVPGMIQVHENAAMLTLIGMIITGTFAWFGLWEFRRFSRASSLTSAATLLAATVTAALILYTGSLGGKISHPEIRDPGDAAVTVEAGWQEPVELFVSAHSWVWPAAETLHFLGMSVLFGVSLLLLMRMLGAVKGIPYTAIHRLLPLGVIGFLVNVSTGMLFFIASPQIYLGKNAFHIKMTCILLASIPILYFTLFDGPWQTGSNENATATSKIAAVCTFGLLVAVVIYGRLLPFLN
jgi:uncharacterized membrane protein